MADVTVKRIDEMEAVFDGVMVRARASLGVTSFGMQVEDLPPNFEHYPEHDEVKSGQEEVFTALSGSARLIVGGQEFALEPGVFARVGKGERRRIVPGPKGVRILALGGVPGQAFQPAEWTDLGAPQPNME
jgi:mannose-6-phosphate isomerase-like protein (cupin superfamily)